MKKSLWIIALCIAILIPLLVINYYFNSTKNQPVVTLYPENNSPTKIRPKESSGIIIPNTENRIYDTLVGNKQVKRVVKRQQSYQEVEQPLQLNRERIIDDIEDIFDDALSLEQEAEHIQDNTWQNKLNIINLPPKNPLQQNFAQYSKVEDNNYQIQIAYTRSEEDGLIIWNEIKKKYPKILQNNQVFFKKITKSENKFYYLILSGPYASFSKANLACKRLIARKQHCIVYDRALDGITLLHGE